MRTEYVELPAAILPLPDGDAVLVTPPLKTRENFDAFKTWMLLMIDLAEKQIETN